MILTSCLYVGVHYEKNLKPLLMIKCSLVEPEVFPDVILVLLLTQIWTEFLSGGKMVAYAFIVQKIPSIVVS
jgi:hypothetical protein